MTRDFATQWGSSPPTRGKQRRMILPTSRPRLIPAHAGKTSSFSWLLRRSAARPRSCGENRCILVDQWSRWGSSPLMRGKRVPEPGA